MTKIYPEITGYMNRDRRSPPPAFPDECPVCKAPRTFTKVDADQWGVAHATYACGGRYDLKPQIQNHTNYWWGSCGA